MQGAGGTRLQSPYIPICTSIFIQERKRIVQVFTKRFFKNKLGAGDSNQENADNIWYPWRIRRNLFQDNRETNGYN